MKKTNWTVGLLGVRNALLILGGIGLQKSNKQKTNGTGEQTMIKFYTWYIEELEAQEKTKQADEQGIERYADDDR